MSGFIDMDLGDTPELSLIPEGERELRVIDTDVRESNSGNQMLVLTMEYPQDELTEELNDYFVFPQPDDDQRTVIRKKGSLEEVCDAFGVDYSAGGFDPNDFIGERATAIISHSEDPEYGESANVQRYVTPA